MARRVIRGGDTHVKNTTYISATPRLAGAGGACRAGPLTRRSPCCAVGAGPLTLCAQASGWAEPAAAGGDKKKKKKKGGKGGEDGEEPPAAEASGGAAATEDDPERAAKKVRVRGKDCLPKSDSSRPRQASPAVGQQQTHSIVSHALSSAPPAPPLAQAAKVAEKEAKKAKAAARLAAMAAAKDAPPAAADGKRAKAKAEAEAKRAAEAEDMKAWLESARATPSGAKKSVAGEMPKGYDPMAVETAW